MDGHKTTELVIQLQANSLVVLLVAAFRVLFQFRSLLPLSFLSEEKVVCEVGATLVVDRMPTSHSILVSAALIHLSPAERKQAIQSLLLLGLTRYANNAGGSTVVDPSLLQKLHGTSFFVANA